MRNIKLTIEYDGTNYSGWQDQQSRSPDRRKDMVPGAGNKVLTIQGVLRDALEKITQEHIGITGAGRTDAGVHAQGQVANFLTASALPVERFPFAINAQVPRDIVVRSAEEVPLNFNARRDAAAREYRYIIFNHRFRSAVMRLYSYHVPFRLDTDAMLRAARLFRGIHDFSGFTCSSGRGPGRTGDRQDTAVTAGDHQGDGTPGDGYRPFMKHIMKLDIEKKDDFFYITVKANSFLMHMVRYMVAALLDVGKQQMKPEDIKFYLEPVLKKWTRSRAPAHGLCLMRVEY